jgi:hypothetical protein
MIEKEFRALLPLWGICAAALLATALDLPMPIRLAAAGVYIPACAALGAYTFGHEYVHGTMPLLLAQPMARGRIYLAKLGVLALLLAALRALLFVVPFPEGHSALGSLIGPLPILVALFLAPWLTLVTRTPLAGAMFSMGLGGIVLLTSEWVALGAYGFTEHEDPFKIALIRWTMLALCAIGAVMGWRTFDRLETAGGGGGSRSAASTRHDAAPARATLVRRSPVWLLVGKELRLQQITFVVAAMFVGFYLFVALRRDPDVDRSSAVAIISATNIVVSSLIIGSLGSAEERHLGTLDWQLLLPMSAARQWAVKITVLLALTMFMTVLLPLALVWLVPPGSVRLYRSALPNPAMTAAVAMVCLTTSLYVSSLVSSGIRALVTSLPTLLAVITFTRLIGTPGAAAIAGASALSAATRQDVLLAALGTLLIGVLWVALANHRTAERGWRRVIAQAGGIAGGLIILVATAQVLGLL